MRVAIIGYGKMGHMIASIARQRGHLIVCAIDKECSENNTTSTQKKEDSFPIFTPEVGFASEAFRSADVAIEFSTPATAEYNVRHAWAEGIPVVCGTTGWDAASLMEEGRRQGHILVWKSNFSVGVNIFFDLNEYLAEQMNRQPQYVPSVSETHHIHKLDKPSGTAKTIAEGIAQQLKRDVTQIPIESIRQGEVPGIHTVTWDSPEDTIVITHIAKGRQGFALGAIIEAEKIINQN